MPVRPTKVVYSYSSLLRPIDIAYVDEAHKKFKKFCDDLRCPLCGSQLDGNVHNQKAELYCVTNNSEYKCRWFPNEVEPDTEIIRFWYYPYEYEINSQQVGPSNFNMSIVHYDMDANPIWKNSTRIELFKYQGPRILAFRQRMEEAQFLKKIKTIKVFS